LEPTVARIRCVGCCAQIELRHYGDNHEGAADILANSYWNTRPASAVAEAAGEKGWQPIETAPKGRKLIVGYFNEAGKWRSVMGHYYLPETLECDEAENGFADEGWYEDSDSLEQITRTSCQPTHWQTLPAAPAPASATPASPACAIKCVCGDPSKPDTMHRSDGPCYQMETVTTIIERKPASPAEGCATCQGFRVINKGWQQEPCPDCAPSPALGEK
jgi:hypothetical protein